MALNKDKLLNIYSEFESKIKGLKDLSKEDLNEFLVKAKEYKSTELKKIEETFKVKTNEWSKNISEKSRKIREESVEAQSKAQKFYAEYKEKLTRAIETLK